MNITNGVNVTGSGLTIQRTVQRTVEGANSREVSLPAAKAGTLTTRTNNTDGTITLANGHGITTGMTVDLYFSGGTRYQVTVGTVSGNSVPISSGAGFNLPTQGSAIVVCQQQQINVGIDGARLSLFACEVGYADPNAVASAILRLDDAAASPLTQLYLTGNLPIVADLVGNNGNPTPGASFTLSSLSDKLWITHSSTSVGTLKLIWAVDATP